MLKQWIKKLVARCATPTPLEHLSYAQEGEDKILQRLFSMQSTGFYVDIGAHHPTRFSNTYLLYQQNWRGINVDAMPGSAAAFHELRPRDITLEVGVGLARQELEYFIFNDGALNTFSKELAAERASIPAYKILRTVKIPVVPLAELLEKHLPKGQKIDFMSIDAEGLDHEILLSNDWKRFAPQVIVTESLGVNLQNYDQSELKKLLEPMGYELFSKTYHSMIFVKDYASLYQKAMTAGS